MRRLGPKLINLLVQQQENKENKKIAKKNVVKPFRTLVDQLTEFDPSNI
jgi:hypothetical protein